MRNYSFQKLKLVLCFIVFFAFLPQAFAEDIAPLPLFTKEDRVLILAPHPDDEAIGTAGVIQQALKLNLPIKIVYLTNGDNNQLAFIVYEKHPVLSRAGMLKMGETRRKEAVSAMASLGVKREDLIFLGYPDFGTMNILTEYWGKTRPYKGMMTRVKAVPYKECLSPKAPYVGESVLKDLKFVLESFKPTKIFVTNAVDTNGDHRAASLFLQIALWDSEGKIPKYEIYPYLIHVLGWPSPRGFHPELRLDPPKKLSAANIDWENFDLSEEEIQKKKRAIAFYKSQIEYNPPYLFTFARQNELYGSYPEISLQNLNDENINWAKLRETENIRSDLVNDEALEEKIVESVSYARRGKFLDIRIVSRNWKDKLLGINLYLLGYRKDTPFAKMPKYRIRLSLNRKATIFEKQNVVFIKDLKFDSDDGGIIIHFPLDSLDNPKYILCCVKTHVHDLPLDLTAWRTLRLE